MHKYWSCQYKIEPLHPNRCITEGKASCIVETLRIAFSTLDLQHPKFNAQCYHYIDCILFYIIHTCIAAFFALDENVEIRQREGEFVLHTLFFVKTSTSRGCICVTYCGLRENFRTVQMQYIWEFKGQKVHYSRGMEREEGDMMIIIIRIVTIMMMMMI